jgi:hypothetical protein
LLNNNKRQDRQVRTDNTTTDRLSLAFTSTARTITRVTLGHQKTNTVRQQNTLLHGETLLIVTTRDTENVTLEFISERIAGDFLGHTLVIETTAKEEDEKLVSEVKGSVCSENPLIMIYHKEKL